MLHKKQLPSNLAEVWGVEGREGGYAALFLYIFYYKISPVCLKDTSYAPKAREMEAQTYKPVYHTCN